ncbi:hypothetical protein RRF57_005013 [Xylaria bambusicola]|uniref:Enoyl reductase (ER) domain-containing protein n=1 Tax=Xylaria bambusicola TaxID=326684 RepID=A0AAN7UL76_9PEZI
MRAYPCSDEQVVVKISSSPSFEVACAVVIPGMIALQSLVAIAQIRKRENTLIHSASGGTGQMAIQLAQKAGGEVFATVGNHDKKQLLID